MSGYPAREALPVDLREFVTQTLVQIVEGVADAQEAMRLEDKKIKAVINARHSGDKLVEFDVAVSASSESSKSGGGSLQVFSFLGGGADVAQADTWAMANRVRFAVNVSLPNYESGNLYNDR